MQRVIIFTVLCILFLVSCKQQGQIHSEHRIHLGVDSGFIYCYADSQKIIFNNDYFDGGAARILLHQNGKYVYAIGDLIPCSNGWTVRYVLCRIDIQTLETKHIGDFAAIHFDRNGFKTAIARLTNPDAGCTAEEVWVMHNNYYTHDGVLIRKDKNEYYYDDMKREYGDTLVNVSRENGWY